MMDKDTMPEESSPRKVYRYSPRPAFVWLHRIFLWLIALVAVGYGYVWYLTHFQNGWAVLMAALWLLLAAWQWAVLYLHSRAQLITSPEGLEYFIPGYSISTTWDNMEMIEMRQFLSQQVLHLRQKPTLHSSNPLSWFWLRPWTNRQLIHLNLFHQSWEGELGQDFRRYAPHLFSTEEKYPYGEV